MSSLLSIGCQITFFSGDSFRCRSPAQTWCWFITSGGPTLNHLWLNLSCLLGSGNQGYKSWSINIACSQPGSQDKWLILKSTLHSQAAVFWNIDDFQGCEAAVWETRCKWCRLWQRIVMQSRGVACIRLGEDGDWETQIKSGLVPKGTTRHEDTLIMSSGMTFLYLSALLLATQGNSQSVIRTLLTE